MDEPNDAKWRVDEVRRENHDVTSVFVSGPMRDMAGRRAGQFASVRIPVGDGWSPPHSFTISCPPSARRLRFTIKSVDEFTASAPSWEPGMPVQVAGPMGSFCADVAAHPRVVFIAGGVGITPFLSVLRHFLDVGADTCVLLLWANKTVADAFAARELEGMARRLDLTVVHAISRESPPAPMGGPVAYAKGRIAPAMLQGRVGLADEGYYLCGPPQMQDAVLELLESMGVDRAMVATERFTFVR